MHLGRCGYAPTQQPFELTQQSIEPTQLYGTQFYETQVEETVASSSSAPRSPHVNTTLDCERSDIEDLYADEDDQALNRNDSSQRSRVAEGDDETTTRPSEGSSVQPQLTRDPDQENGRDEPTPNPTIPWDEHTIQDEQMVQLGIAVNTELRILTCIKCKQAIDPSAIRKHIRRDLPHVAVTDEYCEGIRQKYSLIPRDELTPPTGLRPAVPNLELRSNYFYCSVCFHAVKLRTSLANKNVHSCPVYEARRGYAQAYFPSHNQGGFFAVTVPEQPPPNEAFDLVGAFKSKYPEPLPQDQPIAIPEDARNTHSFLTDAGWANIVNGLTGRQVWEAARGADRGTKGLISPSIGKYVDDINAELQKAETYSWGVAIGSYNGCACFRLLCSFLH